MKKRSFVWIVLLLCSFGAVKGQVLKIENGVAITSLNIAGQGHEGTFFPYQMSIGLDYMDRGWYGLSSSIGYLRKGSKDDVMISLPEVGYAFNGTVKETFSYITANTTFRIKGTTRDNFTLYAGLGPRLDLKISDGVKWPKIDGLDPGSTDLDGRSLIIGLKTEVGVNYNFNRYQVGLNFSYLPSFNKPMPGGVVKERTFTAGIVLGYVL